MAEIKLNVKKEDIRIVRDDTVLSNGRESCVDYLTHEGTKYRLYSNYGIGKLCLKSARAFLKKKRISYIYSKTAYGGRDNNIKLENSVAIWVPESAYPIDFPD